MTRQVKTTLLIDAKIDDAALKNIKALGDKLRAALNVGGVGEQLQGVATALKSIEGSLSKIKDKNLGAALAGATGGAVGGAGFGIGSSTGAQRARGAGGVGAAPITRVLAPGLAAGPAAGPAAVAAALGSPVGLSQGGAAAASSAVGLPAAMALPPGLRMHFASKGPVSASRTRQLAAAAAPGRAAADAARGMAASVGALPPTVAAPFSHLIADLAGPVRSAGGRTVAAPFSHLIADLAAPAGAGGRVGAAATADLTGPLFLRQLARIERPELRREGAKTEAAVMPFARAKTVPFFARTLAKMERPAERAAAAAARAKTAVGAPFEEATIPFFARTQARMERPALAAARAKTVVGAPFEDVTVPLFDKQLGRLDKTRASGMPTAARMHAAQDAAHEAAAAGFAKDWRKRYADGVRAQNAAKTAAAVKRAATMRTLGLGAGAAAGGAGMAIRGTFQGPSGIAAMLGGAGAAVGGLLGTLGGNPLLGAALGGGLGGAAGGAAEAALDTTQQALAFSRQAQGLGGIFTGGASARSLIDGDMVPTQGTMEMYLGAAGALPGGALANINAPSGGGISARRRITTPFDMFTGPKSVGVKLGFTPEESLDVISQTLRSGRSALTMGRFGRHQQTFGLQARRAYNLTPEAAGGYIVRSPRDPGALLDETADALTGLGLTQGDLQRGLQYIGLQGQRAGITGTALDVAGFAGAAEALGGGRLGLGAVSMGAAAGLVGGGRKLAREGAADPMDFFLLRTLHGFGQGGDFSVEGLRKAYMRAESGPTGAGVQRLLQESMRGPRGLGLETAFQALQKAGSPLGRSAVEKLITGDTFTRPPEEFTAVYEPLADRAARMTAPDAARAAEEEALGVGRGLRMTPTMLEFETSAEALKSAMENSSAALSDIAVYIHSLVGH